MTSSGDANHAAGRHTVHMEQRKQMQITGVTDVYSFNENEITLRIDSATLVLTGENLHISKLLLEEGKTEVTGQIDSMIYEKPRVVRRLFGRKRKNDALF